MFVGTASDVGKSVIATGFCRIFKQDGYHPAPFKAQNMSLNSYATPEGLEIGRAQAVQSEACGIPCHTDMNPVLLKPTSDTGSQLILHGRPAGNMTARAYFQSGDFSGGRERLFSEVIQAFHRLADQYTPIVMEGAGSISELNLKHRDITNMRMAMEAGADAYLITDIDRGGIFGSLYGTMTLLTPPERSCIKGIIINKFRGDPALFAEGRTMLEELCQVPVVGVLPYFSDIFIEEEDSVALARKGRRAGSGSGGSGDGGSSGGSVNIAVVLLDRLSNYTDFDRLERDPRVNLFYTREAAGIGNADIIILPGSKNTLEDLLILRENGITSAISRAAAHRKTVIGICGGYQMMGEWVEDPLHVETHMDRVAGLGLLPVRTVMRTEKTTRQRRFRFRHFSETCHGYEIHMGETFSEGGAQPLNCFMDGDGAAAGHSDGQQDVSEAAGDGYFLNARCWGTYLHGILDNPVVIEDLLSPYTAVAGETYDYRRYKEEQYDRLAALLRGHINMTDIYKSLQS
jgi:adenosylcobyric acid synthase